MKEYIGRRVRLLAPMVNFNSCWKPIEDLPVGIEGVVESTQDGSDMMMVKWDNGNNLNLFVHKDRWELVEQNDYQTTKEV